MKKYRFLLIGLFLLGMSSYVNAQDAYHKDFWRMLTKKNELVYKMYELLVGRSTTIPEVGNPRREGDMLIRTNDYEVMSYKLDENQKILKAVYKISIGKLNIPRNYIPQFYEEAKNNFLILLHAIGYKHLEKIITDDDNYSIEIVLSRDPVVRDKEAQKLLDKKYQVAMEKELQRPKEKEEFLLGMALGMAPQDSFSEILDNSKRILNRVEELLAEGAGPMDISRKGVQIAPPKRVENTIVMISNYERLTFVLDKNQKISAAMYKMNIGNLMIPRGEMAKYYERAKNKFSMMSYKHLKNITTDDNNYSIEISLSRDSKSINN